MKSPPHTLFRSMYKIVNEKQEINSEIEFLIYSRFSASAYPPIPYGLGFS